MMQHEKQWFVDEELIIYSNDATRIKKAAEKAKEKALKRNNVTPVRDWFLVNLQFGTGLRVHEAANLVCADIEFKTEPYRLRVRKGKSGKRTVYFGEDLKKVCEEYFAWKKSVGEGISGNEPLLRSFRTKAHFSTRGLQSSFKRSLERSGIEKCYGIHSCRHSYCTYLLKNTNMNFVLVMRMLGHSSIRTTQGYAHVAEAIRPGMFDNLYSEVS